MPTLDTLLRSRPEFDLDALAAAANELLPDLLPDDPVDARVKPEVNPRLIRHYVSEGLLDPSLREGKRARYTVDHLLQLLALRRLLADGLSSGTIGDSLRHEDRDALRAIAEGRRTPTPPAPSTEAAAAAPEDARERARAALAAIRGDATGGLSGGLQRSSAPPTPAPRSEAADPAHLVPPGPHEFEEAEAWERLPLLDGVELHVRSDVRLPTSLAARQRLLDHVVREIVRYAQRRDR